MIIAELLAPSENSLYMRFSNPNQDFGKNEFFPVATAEEAKRKVYFQNRKYVVETMTAWLNQRRHILIYRTAHPVDQSTLTKIDNMISWMYDLEKRSFTNICTTIRNKRMDLESIAPSEKSRFYNYYMKAIVPILDFCTKYE
jgi:hypothetical protein